MRLDVSYIANRGSRLTNNWQSMGVDANMLDPSVLEHLHSPATDLQRCLPAITSLCCFHRRPWRRRCGDIPSTRTSCGAMCRPAAASTTPWKSYWSSVSLTGFSSVSGYTYSRLNNDGAESAQGGNGVNATIQNPACPHVCEWGLSQDDTPHVFLVGYSWEIPGAKRFNGAAGAILGGWNLSGALRYESGRPTEHLHEQRPRRLDIQRTEAAKPGERRQARSPSTVASSIRSP